MIKINLKKLLSERNMTQAELANTTGIRPSTVCDIYNNNARSLKVENINKICTSLSCGISDLITYMPTSKS